MENQSDKNQDGKNKNRFTEQQAPEKNTDNAFVKVGRDGHPEIPKEEKDTKEEEGSVRHR